MGGKWTVKFSLRNTTTNMVWTSGSPNCVRKHFLAAKNWGEEMTNWGFCKVLISQNLFQTVLWLFFRLKSSQNVALMQYRIPIANEGFIFRVSMERNDDRKSWMKGQKHFLETRDLLYYYPSFIFWWRALVKLLRQKRCDTFVILFQLVMYWWQRRNVFSH